MEYIYATLTLNELGEELNQENITAVLEAAGSDVIESRVKAIVAALEDVDLDDIGTEAGIPPAPTPDAVVDAEPSTPDEEESPQTAGETGAGDVDAGETGADELDGDDSLAAGTVDVDELDAPEASGLEATSPDDASEQTSAGVDHGTAANPDEHLETDGGAGTDESGAE